MTKSRLLPVGQERFTELVDRFPGLGWAAATEVTRWCDDLFAEIDRRAFGFVRQRLAFHLLSLSAIEHGGGSAPIRQRNLVLAVGSPAEVIRRSVLELESTGLVSNTHIGVVVIDRIGLERVAAERS